MQAALGLSFFFSLLGKVIKMALGQVLSRAEDNLALQKQSFITVKIQCCEIFLLFVSDMYTTIQKFGVGNNFYMFVYLFDHIVETENISNIIII